MSFLGSFSFWAWGATIATVGFLVSKLPFFQYKHVKDLGETLDHISTGFLKDAAAPDNRRAVYAKTTEALFNIATDFYEWGWGQSFHFAPRFRNESIESATQRYEHLVAANLGLSPVNRNGKEVRVVDLGCGIGGPMRTIARFFSFKVRITGVNITTEHVVRANNYNKKFKIENCDVIQADFNKIPVPDNTFDGAYEMEAFPHSADLSVTFAEAYRILKPGARMVTTQYCLLKKFDPANSTHVDVIRRIDNYSCMYVSGRTADTTREIIKKVGFEVVSDEDLFSKEAKNEVPYEAPLATPFRKGPFLVFIRSFLSTFESFRVLPKGITSIYDIMIGAGTSYREAGEMGLLTVGHMFVIRKPVNAK